MNRGIGMIIIAVLLVGFGIWQEIYVGNIIKNLTTMSYQLEVVVDDNEDNIDVTPVHKEFEKLKSFWGKTEHTICYIVNFEKVKYINESIIKLEGAIDENDFSVAMENVKTLQNYSKALKYIMGLNLNNIL